MMSLALPSGDDMKKLTCRDLGGPCDQEIVGADFEEIGQKCRAHVTEAVQQGDAAHKASVDRMMEASPAEQAEMMAEYRKRFEEAPEIQ
jgi:predicted small metal-binding protein